MAHPRFPQSLAECFRFGLSIFLKTARRTASSAGHKATRMLSVLLCLSLLATSTPAAPPILKDLASGARLGAALWLDASGWSSALLGALAGQRRPSAVKEQKQEERDGRVARVEISPGGELTARMGERVRFVATAFDEEGATVGGVKFKWQALDVERNRKTRISPSGQFEARALGVFNITVEGAGHQAHVTIKVSEGERLRRPDEKPEKVRDVSTRDLPAETSMKKRQARPRREEQARRSGEAVFMKASYAPAAAPAAAEPAAAMLPADGWNQDNYYYADDPGNEPGNPPGGPQDGGAGNGNFQIAAPVLSLPGRGIDLSLALTYNSRVWSKTSYYEMTFDPDRTWPAPGWSLGFGKMVGMGMSGSMLVEPDGTRRGFSGTATNYGASVYFNGKTSDGSFIDYYSTTYNGSMYYGYAQLPNGTYIEYGAYGDGALYPTLIRDANGNYIAVTYRNNRGPQIQTVTDTLGRVVTFNYDGSGLLTSVAAPGLGGGSRTVVELQYSWRAVNYNFPGLTPRVRSASFPFLQAIRYPGTGTGYWFGDADSYSPYGMIAKVSERRGMGTSGAIAAGVRTADAVYNYPMDTSVGYADAPGYTSKTETWEGMDTAAAVTSYAIFQNASPRRVEITYPDNTKSIQYSHNSPGTFLDGLIYNSETRDPAGALLQSSTVTWQQGAYSSPRPSQVEMTGQHQQTKKTQYSYGPVYNQVTESRDYDYGGTTLLRKTVTGYENGANYVNNHIFNLPKTVEVYAADGVTRASRTEFQYDGQPLADTPGVIMHMESHNPHAPQYWVDEYCYQECYDYPYDCQWRCDPGYWQTDYIQSTDYRGNITQVTTYADAVNLGGAAVETSTYDINGNKVTTSTSCCEQTRLTYSAAMHYAYPVTQSRGSASTPSARNTNHAAYDFHTGSLLSRTDENGRTSQTNYQAGTLRPQAFVSPTGAQTTYAYDDTSLKVIETTTAAPAEGGAVAGKNVKYLNGKGQVRREEALGGAEASPWEYSVLDAVETKYDQLGRIWKQSRPYRVGVEQARMTEYFYDHLSRPVEAVEPDGSRTRAYYNQATRPSSASGLPGETSRIVDPWGRERWSRVDALGRLAEVVEPDPNGGGSVLGAGDVVTSYGYDTLGSLTLVTQGGQQRRFRYDSRGRLTHQKLAESSATLNDAGQYVGAGTWSEVFSYDARSNLVSRRDARGVVTTFNYGNDPLNRLQSASYALGTSYDTSQPLLPAAAVTYQYMAAGDLTRVRSVRAAGVSTEEYAYDSEGRMQEQKLTLDARPYHPMVINYGYDTLDRLKNVTYPQQYPSATRKTVTHSYDVASRLNGLQVGGVAYASDFTYNAASQTTSLKVGVGVGNWKQEKYDYDPISGMLQGQKVLRAGDESLKILDLSYDYLRPGTTEGRSGQLTKVTNNLDQTKNRTFEYDALGRLRRATGGLDGRWAQRYHYDRYGNRWNTFSQTAEQLVRNFYQASLNRQPNTSELQQWTNAMQAAYGQGNSQLVAQLKSMGDTLFGSAEYAARNRSDRDYVFDLYKAYLNRNPDQGGWDFWTSIVPSSGRAGVRDGFVYSEEASLNLQGMSPYSPANGLSVPRDGLGAMSFDQTTNRVNLPGWQYDASGNQVRSQTATGAWQRMEYDMAGRLVRVKDDAGNLLASNTYGDSNARIGTQEGATRTYYAWLSGSVVAEYTETDGTASYNSPQWSKSYLYLGGRLLATQTAVAGSERVEYHHPERLGTRVVSNAHDANSFEQSSLPFGSALSAESTGATNRRFTSYERSPATGLDYAVNRHYDSMQGRFTQVDPLEMGAVNLSDPQSLNLYAYCTNDPVNGYDPAGLWNPFKAIWNGLKAIGRGIVSAIKAVAVAISAVLTNKWVLLAVGIALGVMAGFAFYWAAIEVAEVAAGFLKAGIILAGMSAALITSAFHPGVQRVFQIAGSVLSTVQGGLSLIIGGGTILGTPGWNPNSGNSFQATGPGVRRRRRGDFPSLTDAAIAALRRFNSQSITDNREYAGSICESADGSLTYTIPNAADGSIGTNASSVPSPCGAGTTRVGTYHTHAAFDPLYDNENFSPADRINANNRSIASGHVVPSFLATPSGRIRRFDPAVIAGSQRGRVSNLRARTPIP